MIIKSGKDPKDLFKTLKDLDELTQLDSIKESGDKIVATLSSNNSYTLELVKKEKTERLAAGRTFASLEKSLEELTGSPRLDYNLDVLALAEAKVARTYSGMCQTKWAVFNPTVPYEVKGNGVPLNFISIEMTQTELRAASESGLAIYDEEQDLIYLIRKCSLSSVGKLLDCVTAFKYATKFQFSAAIQIAERLCTAKGKVMITRGTGRIRSLIGIVTERTKLYPQLDFVSGCMDAIKARYNEAEVIRWVVADETTIVRVSGGPGHEVRIVTGDAPGTAMSVSAYGRIGPGHVFLLKNKSNHWSGYKDRGEAESLLADVFEAFKAFDRDVECLKNAKPVKLDLSVFEESLGSKRIASIAEEAERISEESAYKALEKVINLTSQFRLGETQAYDLEKAYGNLFIEQVAIASLDACLGNLSELREERRGFLPASRPEIKGQMELMTDYEFFSSLTKGVM